MHLSSLDGFEVHNQWFECEQPLKYSRGKNPFSPFNICWWWFLLRLFVYVHSLFICLHSVGHKIDTYLIKIDCHCFWRMLSSQRSAGTMFHPTQNKQYFSCFCTVISTKCCIMLLNWFENNSLEMVQQRFKWNGQDSLIETMTKIDIRNGHLTSEISFRILMLLLRRILKNDCFGLAHQKICYSLFRKHNSYEIIIMIRKAFVQGYRSQLNRICFAFYSLKFCITMQNTVSKLCIRVRQTLSSVSILHRTHK